MSEPAKVSMLSVRVSEKQHRSYARAARRAGVSLATYVRDVLDRDAGEAKGAEGE